MAENPIRRLARLMGGVALMQGGLGHQVLGQLLVADTGDAVLAGAMMVITGTSRQRNIVAQAALRTAAPTLAAHWFLRSRELHLQRREAGLAELELKRQRIDMIKAVIQHRSGRRAAALEKAGGMVVLAQPVAAAPAAPVEAPDVAALRQDHQRLQARFKRLSAQIKTQAAAVVATPPKPKPKQKTKKRAKKRHRRH